MFAILKGRKTYVTGILSVIGTIASVLVGDVSIIDGAQVAVPALLAIFLRNGMK